MLCCLNPNCDQPLNPDNNKYCQRCRTPLISLLVGHFKIIRPLGLGGFGKTYLAEDTHKMNESCVVKQLIYQGYGTQPDPKALELFKREAEQLKNLKSNQKIPDLWAYFEDGGYFYLVQEYIDGQDLEKELRQNGTFSDTQIKELLVELLPVLQYIHERGLIHRDLKPPNIMRRNSDGKLLLIDFGVSRQLSNSLTTRIGKSAVTVVGTQGYSPYEQMRQVDANPVPASDLYSLGATCFHLITGVSPGDLWTRDGSSWVKQWQQHLPQPLSEQPVSQAVGAVLDKLLQFEVADRYQTGNEVLADLAQIETQVYADNLNRYKQEFSKAVQLAYPLDEHVRENFKQYQQDLGLRDDDTVQVEQPILAEAEKRQQKKLRQEAKARKHKQPPTPSVQATPTSASSSAPQISSSGYCEQGWIKFNQGEFEPAYFLFGKAISSDPNNADAYYGRGEASLMTDRLDKGIKNFQNAYALYVKQGKIYESKRVKKKLDDLEQSYLVEFQEVKKKPDDLKSTIGSTQTSTADTSSFLEKLMWTVIVLTFVFNCFAIAYIWNRYNLFGINGIIDGLPFVLVFFITLFIGAFFGNSVSGYGEEITDITFALTISITGVILSLILFWGHSIIESSCKNVNAQNFVAVRLDRLDPSPIIDPSPQPFTFRPIEIPKKQPGTLNCDPKIKLFSF
jgi:serine/threonine protein kinase